jgi:hypothetical protein
MSHGKKSKRKKKKHPTGHEHPEGDAKLNNKPEHVNISGKIEADFPPNLIEKYDTASNKENGWNRKQFVVSLVTAILIFVYTTVAAWQGCSSKRAAVAATSAANTAEKTLKSSIRAAWLEQRAWVNLSSVPADVWNALKDGQPINVPFILDNTGKTPAKKVCGTILIQIVKNGEQPDFNRVTGGTNYVFPNVVPQYHEKILAPAFEPPEKPMILDPEVHKSLLAGRSHIFDFGKLEYVDVWNVKHWVTFCGMPGTSGGGPLACANYNQIDDNEPPETQ